jgi:hypothetical protein
MNTTNDGGPVHPMVMKAARGLCREVAHQMEEPRSELWANERDKLITAAQAALEECGALECLEALESARGYVSQVLSVDGEEVSEIDKIIAKVYGSAPE